MFAFIVMFLHRNKRILSSFVVFILSGVLSSRLYYIGASVFRQIPMFSYFLSAFCKLKLHRIPSFFRFAMHLSSLAYLHPFSITSGQVVFTKFRCFLTFSQLFASLNCIGSPLFSGFRCIYLPWPTFIPSLLHRGTSNYKFPMFPSKYHPLQFQYRDGLFLIHLSSFFKSI